MNAASPKRRIHRRLMNATTIKSPKAGLSQNVTYQVTPAAQKISTGVSLVTLGSGFAGIGLLSLYHGPLSGDAADLSAASCLVGAMASLAASTIFFVAAFCYWRRYSPNTEKAKAPKPQPSGLFRLVNQIATCETRAPSTGRSRPANNPLPKLAVT
jgi:hypothetical protein